MICFTCNICGRDNSVEALPHEGSSCSGCRSGVRLRALIYTLSMELFGEALILPEFPCLPAVKGLGLSDQLNYASVLAGKFDYVNTFYDRQPHLDITEPHPHLHGTYDFILSSDVFEHISVPVDRAFEEVYKLLKPHGVLCLTTPFSLREDTAEHFPDLHDYAIVQLSGAPVLINRKKDGTLEVREDLVFHGGVGATLEMRLFSRSDLERKLTAAGFETIFFQADAIPRFGIQFEGDWSLPLVARKSEFVFSSQAIGQFTRDFSVRSAQLTELRKHCADLTSRLEMRGQQVDQLDAELVERAGWALSLQDQLDESSRNLKRKQAEFEAEQAKKAEAADELQSKLEAVERQIRQIADSRWIKLGNKLGVGPNLR